MNISGRRIWQVAAGDTNRDYADVLLDWDAIAVGPGRYGLWPESQHEMRKAPDRNWTERKIAIVRCFCEDIIDGDMIVLRLGTGVVRGVGVVVGEYELHDEFGDVDGWDLEHCHRVRWLWRGEQKFPAGTLKFGDTVQPLDSRNEQNHAVRDWLGQLNVGADAWSRPIRDLPPNSGYATTVQEVADHLFDHGVASGSVKNLLAEMDDLVRIARWYTHMGDKPPEHETVSYLVIPLLRALGWTPQKMAIEWNHVDVALFGFLPRKPQNLTGVVEAKKWGNSCLSAHGQAERYADQHGGTLCSHLIVTDGMRYGTFQRKPGQSEFDTKPNAYLNLTRLRTSYPLLACGGAAQCLEMMSSDYRAVDE